MQTKVWLDLEDTIIDLFDSARGNNLVNIEPVKQWLFSIEAVKFGIFSFAIWTDVHKKQFDLSLRRRIETTFGLVTEVLSVEEMASIVSSFTGVRFGVDEDHPNLISDFININGKHDAFIKVCLARERNCTCFLLDDVVPNRTVIDHDKNVTIHLVNVKKIGGCVDNVPPSMLSLW